MARPPARASRWRSLNHRLALRLFPFFERWFGLHVTPVHYYSPIPDTGALPEAVFETLSDCPGIDWNLEAQLDFGRRAAASCGQEFAPVRNSGLSLSDAFVLYAMIRERKPAVMYEIGSGESTFISLAAIEKNAAEGHPCRLTAVEPYPRQALRDIAAPHFRLLERPVESLDPALFAEADLVFIDSSHVSRIGGDVNFEMLELVPRLKPGAAVHWHDIMIPRNYWREWTMAGDKFWNESYLLHAFLLFNSAFRVLWAGQYLQSRHPEALDGALGHLKPLTHRLTSLWIERAGP